MKRIPIIVTIWAILTGLAFAGNSNAGKNAYSFLKIGVGAKAEAMAGAFVALSDDISSLYNNPAGLAAPVYDIRAPRDYYAEDSEGEVQTELTKLQKITPKKNRFYATYINYLLDIQSGYLAYARTLNDQSALGISIQYQDYGTLDSYDSYGEYGGTFGASDFAFGVTYSKQVNQKLSLGITGKFILEDIDTVSSDGVAMDAGILYRLDDGRTSLGATVKNLGFELKGFTKSHKDPLPLLFDIGFAHSLRGIPLTISTDVSIPTDNDIYFALGGQFEAFRPFYIRAGWSSQGDDYKTGSDKDKLAGLAFGFGFHYGDYNIDYSYSSYADIDNVHRISFAVDVK